MRITKITVLLVLSFCLLFTSCKQTDNESIASTLETSSTQTQVMNIEEADDTTDPENTENNLGEGSKISLQQIEKKTGKANGVDVSYWQGKIDWKAVKTDGIDFAIIRIGYRGENGKIYRDSNADYNIQQAQKAGVLVGVYFFSTAINRKEAEDEARFVINAIKGYKVSCPVVYDCEGYLDSDSRMYNLTSEERTENAVSFLEKIKNSGYEPMFYGAKSEIENSEYWDIETIENKYKIWLAYYSSPTYPQIEIPEYNGKYNMWQFTNRGSVKGINGNCDLIVSYEQFKEAKAKDKNAKLPTATVPKTEEEKLYTDVSDSVTAKEAANLRVGAGTNYEIVGTLKNGDFIKRIGIGKNGWSKLKYNGKTVYAITSYLTDEVIEVPQKDIVNGMEFTPKSDKLTAKEEVNLRTLPTTDSESVGKLVSGTFLERTAVSDGGWSRLKYKGKTVYAVTSYLTDKVVEVPEKDIVNGMEFTPKNDKVTAKMEVNLRRLPTTDSTSEGKLVSGTFLKRTAISSNGWSRLEYNGKTVYAVSNYLATKAPEIISTPSELNAVTEHGMTFNKVTQINVTAKEETNLRDKPTTDSNVVYTLKNGEYVTKNAVSDSGWARLEYDGKTVYAIDSFLLYAE